MALSAENLKKLIAELRRDEGVRYEVYLCSMGKRTIGVGHNLDANPFTEAQIDYLLSSGKRTLRDIKVLDIKLTDEEVDRILSDDIAIVWQGLVGIFGDAWKEWDSARQRAVCNLIFNLGATGFQQFRRTIDCINRRDWGLAADAIMRSKYATQVGARAKRISEQLRNGGD